VTVTPPGQQGPGGAGGAPPQVNLKVANIVNPALMGDYLNSDDGEQLLVNLMHKNGFRNG
jgi:hypothetical protein